MIQHSRVPRWVEWILLALIVLAAFAIRIYKLDSFPDTLMPDEADNVQSSVQILNGFAPVNGLFGVDWTQQPAFSVYKGAVFIAMFGFNIMAIRLPSVIFSTLALIPFYLLLRRQLMVASSLLATILFSTCLWFLNFSRSGWNNSDICLYMLMAMLFLLYAVDATKPEVPRRMRWLYFGLAGFFCALGLYGYTGGRTIVLGIAASFPIALYLYRKHRKFLFWGYILLFAVTAAVFAPQAHYALMNWDTFNRRSSVVLIFNQPNYQEDPTGTLLRQLSRNIRAPWDGSVNRAPRYTPVGEPQLDRLTGLLTLLGMVLSFMLARLKTRFETWLWWLMLLFGWALTQLLTSGTPNGARGVGYLPTFIYFAGIGIDALMRAVLAHFKKISKHLMGATPRSCFLHTRCPVHQLRKHRSLRHMAKHPGSSCVENALCDYSGIS